MVWTLPRTTAPAARRRATDVASAVAAVWKAGAAPHVVVMPATWKMSLIATGIPCSGPRRRPARASVGALARGRARARLVHRDPRVHRVVRRGDALQARLQQRGRRERAVRDAARGLGDREIGWLVRVHGEGSCGARPIAVKTTTHRRKCGGVAFHTKRAFRYPATEATRELGACAREQAIDSTSERSLVQDLPPGLRYGSGRFEGRVSGTGFRSLLHRRVGPSIRPSACLVTPTWDARRHGRMGSDDAREGHVPHRTTQRQALHGARLQYDLRRGDASSLPDLQQHRILPARVVAQPRP